MNLRNSFYFWIFNFTVRLIGCDPSAATHNVTMLSTHTCDVTIKCDAESSIDTVRTSSISHSIRSLQVIQQSSKQNVLASYHAATREYTLSPFLRSSSRIFVVKAGEAKDGKSSWLSVSLSAFHEIPGHTSTFFCRVVYDKVDRGNSLVSRTVGGGSSAAIVGDTNSSDKRTRTSRRRKVFRAASSKESPDSEVWNSRHVLFTAKPMRLVYPGIDVRVSEGLTISCVVTSYRDVSLTNATSIQLLRKDKEGLFNLCSEQHFSNTDLDFSASGSDIVSIHNEREGTVDTVSTSRRHILQDLSSRTQCDQYIGRSVNGSLLLRQRAHFFDKTCVDDVTYFCSFETPPDFEKIIPLGVTSPSCMNLSALNVAVRFGVTLLIFVVGCVLILLVVYSIFLIFEPSSRPFRKRIESISGYYDYTGLDKRKGRSIDSEKKYLGYDRDS